MSDPPTTHEIYQAFLTITALLRASDTLTVNVPALSAARRALVTMLWDRGFTVPDEIHHPPLP
jgi:hypothetical protein